MEFERAIYRVYERCLDGLRDDNDAEGGGNGKSCRFLELFAIFFASTCLLILIILHSQFVGSAGCLPYALIDTNSSSNSSISFPYRIRDDQILGINVDQSLLPTDRLGKHLSHVNNDDASLDTYRPNSFNSFDFINVFKQSGENISNSIDNTTATNIKSNTFNDYIYDYEYSKTVGILVMPHEMRKQHNFETINVTLLGTSCYGGASTRNLIPIGGIDTVILNFVMNTVKDEGYLKLSTNEFFSWSKTAITPYNNFIEFIGFKIKILTLSMLSFFFIASITALLVRVLISSGVVLMFPIFWLLQLFGIHPLDLRIISLSYPWIGLPLELIRTRNQSIVPFITAHLSRVIIYFLLYQAAQFLLSSWFYPYNSPGQQELWLFALMMLWEYYSMIYVRSMETIVIFPRASLALYLIYHFYYYSFPSGFHVLALVTLFGFLLVLMIYCVRVYEIKAFVRGDINIDRTRMLYNALPWPAWRTGLAPDYTVLMPLTHRSQGVYQGAVPLRPGEVPPPEANIPAPGNTNESETDSRLSSNSTNSSLASNEQVNNPIHRGTGNTGLEMSSVPMDSRNAGNISTGYESVSRQLGRLGSRLNRREYQPVQTDAKNEGDDTSVRPSGAGERGSPRLSYMEEGKQESYDS